MVVENLGREWWISAATLVIFTPHFLVVLNIYETKVPIASS